MMDDRTNAQQDSSLIPQPSFLSSRRFRPYPQYRDSTVEWLGEIPAHWEVQRLKHLAGLNPQSLPENTDPDLEMVYVDIGGVDSLGRIVERESLTLSAAPSRARRLVRDGDLIVSTVRTYLRAIAPINAPEPNLVVSTGFAVVRPGDKLITDYAAYALRAPYFVERVVANSKGVSFRAINESEMATYELTVPPLPEQRTIAEFLDRETSKIDVLVAQKERLIELLQEKRTALISHSVTKGLDPDVPMKDSGVTWLGEIPKHWEVARIKHLSRFVTSGSRGWAGYYSEDGSLFLRIGNLNSRTIDLNLNESQHVTPPFGSEGERTRVQPGDLLVSITALIGAVGVVPTKLPEAYVNQHIALVRLWSEHANSRWLAYCILSCVGQTQFLAELYGGTKDGLGLEDIRSLIVLLPPAAEQQTIVEFLDHEAEQLDILILKIREGIDRLKEFRTALISAAVTGNIDVREEVA
jgi:type I restriction enzyme, S subunit